MVTDGDISIQDSDGLEVKVLIFYEPILSRLWFLRDVFFLQIQSKLGGQLLRMTIDSEQSKPAQM